MYMPLKREPRQQRDPDRELEWLRVSDERGRVWLKNFQRCLLAVVLTVSVVIMVMTILNGHLPAGQELHDLVQLAHSAPSP